MLCCGVVVFNVVFNVVLCCCGVLCNGVSVVLGFLMLCCVFVL